MRFNINETSEADPPNWPQTQLAAGITTYTLVREVNVHLIHDGMTCFFSVFHESITDGRIYGQMDGRTDGQGAGLMHI